VATCSTVAPRLRLLLEGRPFQAQFEDTISRTLPDGSIEQRVLKGMIYRDSRGRERRDSCLQVGAQLLLHVAYISDPVTKARYILDLVSKSVIRSLIPYPMSEQSDPGELEQTQSVAFGDGSGLTANIEGLTCYGVRNEFPGGDSIEYWLSRDLKEILVEKRRNGPEEKQFRIFDIRRVEPEETPFVVPSHFTASTTEVNSHENFKS
jgi:hypothetical protein